MQRYNKCFQTSLVSDSSRYKLFGVPDLMPKCNCHMSGTPGPSGETTTAVSDAIVIDSAVPVFSEGVCALKQYFRHMCRQP